MTGLCPPRECLGSLLWGPDTHQLRMEQMPSARKAKEEGPKPFSSFWFTNTAIMSHLSDEFFCSCVLCLSGCHFSPLPQISGALCSKQIVCLSECFPLSLMRYLSSSWLNWLDFSHLYSSFLLCVGKCVFYFKGQILIFEHSVSDSNIS